MWDSAMRLNCLEGSWPACEISIFNSNVLFSVYQCFGQFEPPSVLQNGCKFDITAFSAVSRTRVEAMQSHLSNGFHDKKLLRSNCGNLDLKMSIIT
jgi:hypothetical protein